MDELIRVQPAYKRPGFTSSSVIQSSLTSGGSSSSTTNNNLISSSGLSNGQPEYYSSAMSASNNINGVEPVLSPSLPITQSSIQNIGGSTTSLGNQIFAGNQNQARGSRGGRGSRRIVQDDFPPSIV